VPLGDPIWRNARSLEDVPTHMLKELEHFFSIYKDLEEAKTDTLGWIPLDEATAIIDAAFAAYEH
jgi:inorganic pyrophosphatase